MWHVTSQKNGASALGLQRVLGLGSYQTAWTWLHKLRRAMVRPGRERLSGIVEVDETYWGGPEEGVSGRQTERKALIAVAVEEKGAGMGRVRMSRVRDASAASLIPFVEESVEPDSLVHTDGWLGYEPLEKKGYRHRIVFLSGRSKQASELLPRVHKAISLLKRWMLGTHQGAISHEHLAKWGIHLTQVTPRCSMRRCGGLPARSGGVRGSLRNRGGLPRLPDAAALARRIPLSGLRA
jgi:transposase-like protein